MKPIDYEQVWSDEWFDIPREGLILACCDCGFIHDVKARVRKGKVQLQMSENKRLTTAYRRRKVK